MDPRHPELAVFRMRELMKQYDTIEEQMKKATTSAGLAALEREGSLVVQEICLVAPRIHEAMMQASRLRRGELARTYREDEMRAPVRAIYDLSGTVENPVEIASEGVLEVIDAAKKSTAKKRTTKKKAKK